MTNSNRKCWRIRLNGGKYSNLAKEEGFVAIGWSEIGDASNINKSKIRDLLKKHYNLTGIGLGSATNQIYNFIKLIKIGDLVLVPTQRNTYLIGKIESDYYYVKSPTDKCPYGHRRKVKWLGEIRKEEIPMRLRKAMSAWQTLLDISTYCADIEALLEKMKKVELEYSVGNDSVAKMLAKRLVDLTPEFFQEKLIQSLLTAMGFDVTATPTYTKDGGIDLKGNFETSLFTGNVAIQVKRWKNKIPANLIKEFRGSLEFDQRGIFITTSDFTKDAENEAKSSNKKAQILLINGKRLAELILEYYDNLDDEVKRELKRYFGLERTFVIRKK